MHSWTAFITLNHVENIIVFWNSSIVWECFAAILTIAVPCMPSINGYYDTKHDVAGIICVKLPFVIKSARYKTKLSRQFPDSIARYFLHKIKKIFSNEIEKICFYWKENSLLNKIIFHKRMITIDLVRSDLYLCNFFSVYKVSQNFFNWINYAFFNRNFSWDVLTSTKTNITR